MPKEKFLMVSLEESQAKQLAEVISNNTSRKILNFLAEKEDATETEISELLTIPLPTVHYNLQKLKEAQLVIVEEFHYSKKGREIDHYKLANKYIIITPKPVKGIKTQLRSILPVALIIAGISLIIQLAQKFTQESPPMFAQKAMFAPSAEAGALDAAPLLAQQVTQAAQPAWWASMALWFFIGGISAIVIYLIIKQWRSRE